MLWISLDRTTADNSSKRGMVCSERGATHVFEDKSDIPAHVVTICRKTTTHALADASQNPCSSLTITSPSMVAE